MTVYVYSLENQEVNNPYVEEDYGSISSAPTSSEDIGAVSDPNPTFSFLEDDWYTITVGESLIPYGSLNTLISSVESITYEYIPSGLLFEVTTQTINENVTFTWVGNGTLFEIGNGLERTLRPYVSSGTLRIDDDTAAEAIISFTSNPEEDYVLYNISGISSNREIQIYGINPGNHLYPQPLDVSGGIITITNTSIIHPFVDYTPHYGIDVNIGVATTGIQLSGLAFISEIDSYIGSGSLFGIGEKNESRTYVYDENDFIEFISLDYGFISFVTSESSEDNGDLSYTPSSDNYGLLLDSRTGQQITTGVYPYGSIFVLGISSNREIQVYGLDYVTQGELTFSGSLVEKSTDSYVGVGTVSFSGTVLESYSANTPENTILYTFSGTALDSYSAQTPENTQLFEISGSLVEKSTDSYVGVGTLSLSGTALESYSANTPENTQLFEVSGTLVEKSTDSYVGVGTLSLSGTALESYSANTPENTQLFEIFGTSNESFSKSPYLGLGSVFVLGISSNREIQVYGLDYITQGELTFSGILVEKSTDSYVGVGTLSFSGTTLESYSAQTPEDLVLYTFSGTALESYSANTPEDTQLFEVSGTLVEKSTDSYVGVGTLSLSGSLVEKSTDSYVGVGTVSFSGTALESYSAQTPENTQLFEIFGELTHPNIDYTPHYGIEQNIGIGTTGIQFVSGVGFEPDSEDNPRDARTYSNRYPINDKVPNAGIGTFKFDQSRDTARYSPLTPYTGVGLFNVISGSSPEELYPWLPGIGIGRSWSFTRSTYISSGSISLSGISSNNEIAVYGYYGDDRDPGTSGSMFVSQQTSPVVEKQTYSYVGFGTYTLFGTPVLTKLQSYFCSGVLTLSGTGLESYSAQTPDDTQLFTISGTSLEVYSAQTPEIEVLFIVNGYAVEVTTNSYEGIGSVNLNGVSKSIFVPQYPGKGTLRFVNHSVDNNYDTCDSEEFTCDNQDSAHVSFVSNSPENTILFEIYGDSLTSQIDFYQYTSSGTLTIFGSSTDIKLTHSELGSGTLLISSITELSEVDVYTGSGILLTLSGDSQSYSAQTPESTILLVINGSATTRVESDYPVVGIGLINLDGTSSTRKITSYTQIGSGLITLFGQLVYPDIIYIPSPDGFGSISIVGSSNNSLTKIYTDTSGSLFAFSSGFESFSRPTYAGLGTIYIQEINSETINNPFQIPRTYVTII